MKMCSMALPLSEHPKTCPPKLIIAKANSGRKTNSYILDSAILNSGDDFSHILNL